ncbi:GNAT family N-acetyltransferase [Stakelama tenebrarum]|uniref:GNAT family N-acetyltransferase n=1 Tax=Stakelama tenebrarum TaxID=2711215 RepID=A0A6G6Y678_9SPHN|nr:GNAT family N-acetyltransferase [Sphingosinithalassobacter tenebrarum]QIG80409.1 GNAT family N-acetyltransferase [Sphingosinithalassobacter tenebrarum]
MTSPDQKPLDHPTELTTRSGLVIDVRPATEADEPALEKLFESVSPDDRRFRFLSARDHVGHDQLVAMTKVDHWRTESFLAFDKQSGELLATGMLACDKAMEAAEVAISIRSDRKGQGIGWTLLTFIAEEAMRRGVKRLMSIESRDNHSAIELEREMGFTARVDEDDPTLVVLEATF